MWGTPGVIVNHHQLHFNDDNNQLHQFKFFYSFIAGAGDLSHSNRNLQPWGKFPKYQPQGQFPIEDGSRMTHLLLGRCYKEFLQIS